MTTAKATKFVTAIALFAALASGVARADAPVNFQLQEATIAQIQDALARQLYQPVRWTGCVAELARRGAARVAECGPGKVLTGLVKRIDKGLECRPLGTPGELDAALAAWAGALPASGAGST